MVSVGKFVQLGLHTWLPDAMEVPTPVSYFIYASTMARPSFTSLSFTLNNVQSSFHASKFHVHVWCKIFAASPKQQNPICSLLHYLSRFKQPMPWHILPIRELTLQKKFDLAAGVRQQKFTELFSWRLCKCLQSPFSSFGEKRKSYRSSILALDYFFLCQVWHYVVTRPPNFVQDTLLLKPASPCYSRIFSSQAVQWLKRFEHKWKQDHGIKLFLLFSSQICWSCHYMTFNLTM